MARKRESTQGQGVLPDRGWAANLSRPRLPFLPGISRLNKDMCVPYPTHHISRGWIGSGNCCHGIDEYLAAWRKRIVPGDMPME
jgi:hypothetical protein